MLTNSETTALNTISEKIGKLNDSWWRDIETGKLKDRNIGELLMLVTSELAEAMEGHRKNLMDDKLPQYKMFDVEIADAFIRLFDIVGHKIPHFAEIMCRKLEFNSTRADHKIENCRSENGKKY